YQAILRQLGVTIDTGREGSRMKENKGLVYGILGKCGQPTGVSFKASRLACRPTLLRIEKKFTRNIVLRKDLSPQIRNKVLDVLKRYEQLTRKTFIDELAKQQVHAVFMENKEGLSYGLTLIDHALK